MVTTLLGYRRAFRSLPIFPNPSSTAQQIRMIIISVLMSHLQYGFSTHIVSLSHDDLNLHHWLLGCVDVFVQNPYPPGYCPAVAFPHIDRERGGILRRGLRRVGRRRPGSVPTGVRVGWRVRLSTHTRISYDCAVHHFWIYLTLTLRYNTPKRFERVLTL